MSQTSQLFARINADVQPQWLSEVGDHLVKKTVTHPLWNAERGEVQCTEYHTLFGLQLLKRQCHYGSIEPVEARRRFIGQASRSAPKLECISATMLRARARAFGSAGHRSRSG